MDELQTEPLSNTGDHIILETLQDVVSCVEYCKLEHQGFYINSYLNSEGSWTIVEYPDHKTSCGKPLRQDLFRRRSVGWGIALVTRLV